MSDYCHRKAVRFKIDEERALKLFGVEDKWDLMDKLEDTPFEVAPTCEFFIDYNLPCDYCGDGDWGRVRKLYDSEFDKYEKIFGELFSYQLRFYPSDFRVVEYSWYDAYEAPDYFDETEDDFYKEV